MVAPQVESNRIFNRNVLNSNSFRHYGTFLPHASLKPERIVDGSFFVRLCSPKPETARAVLFAKQNAETNGLGRSEATSDAFLTQSSFVPKSVHFRRKNSLQGAPQ